MLQFNIYEIDEGDINVSNDNFHVTGVNLSDNSKVISVTLNAGRNQRIISKGCVIYMNNGVIKYQPDGSEDTHTIMNGECLALEVGDTIRMINDTPYPANYLVIGNM